MKLADLLERNYVTDPASNDPELKLRDQYKNDNYGKQRKAKRVTTYIRGNGNTYGIRHHVQ